MPDKDHLSSERNETEDLNMTYDKARHDHMRKFLRKASSLIYLIASGKVPLGSQRSAELADALAAEIGYENEDREDEESLQELQDDRQVLVNLYAAARITPSLFELYRQTGMLLRKYGLYDEEAALLRKAVLDGGFSEEKLSDLKERLKAVRQIRDAEIQSILEQGADDAVLYDIAGNTDPDPDLIPLRDKAARMLSSRDYRYALSSHLQYKSRTSMILDLFDPLEGDDLFIARTILADPEELNKLRMLLYCKDKALLMLGWRYVYGAGRTCKDNLHALGSSFPETYYDADPSEKKRYEKEWLEHAAELAVELLSEDEAVRERLKDTADVDSDPLHFFICFHHPRKALRWWHAKQLKNPVRIAYAGSWTSDEEIKEALSDRINSTMLITEMIYGDLSGMDLVFGFRKPDDLTLQDRFCAAIMRNHPDPVIREHVRKELLRGKVTIPGVDLTKPDPLYQK